MTFTLKSAAEIETMRAASRIVADTLQRLRANVKPGISTKELDLIAEETIRSQGAEPAFPYINDFPGSLCISINEEVVHGIPGSRRVKNGDLVKLDVGAIYQGYHGDAALTVGVGDVPTTGRRLVDVTEQALRVGIEAARPGGRLHDIGAAIEDLVMRAGFSVVRQYVGHGIGRELHEDPSVPHFRQASPGPLLRPGMTFTIEPMVNAGTFETRTLADGWTVVTRDRRLSVQFEHTVAITDRGAEILSLPTRGEAWSVPFQAMERVQ